MASFDELVAARKDWIEQILKPWCAAAPLEDLRQAEREWGDIAGRVDPEATLWTWAWGRFPALVHEELSGVDETHAVRVTLHDGTAFSGWPDGRRSRQGRLVLLGTRPDGGTQDHGPFSLDDIRTLERVEG